MYFPLAAYIAARGVFMNQEYRIYADGADVGTVHVHRSGLYYHFSCRCQCNEGTPYRISVFCEGSITDLGLCIPMGTVFGIETKIPVKLVGSGEMRFDARPNNHALEDNFYEVCDTEPFSMLSILRYSYMVTRDGKRGVSAPQTSPSEKVISRPTGQWSEPNTSE